MSRFLLNFRDFVLAPAVAFAIALILTRTSVGASVRRAILGTPAPTGSSISVKNWKQLARAGHSLGDSAAPIKFVVFADFQCPFCRELKPRVHELLAMYPDDFDVVFRHFPLQSHPMAIDAAVAAECAANQGRFPAYHDALFDNETLVAQGAWDSIATIAGIGSHDTFRACRDSTAPRIRVETDRAAGDAIHVPATPAIVVEGEMLIGLPAPGALAERLDKILKRDVRKVKGPSR